ncbi:MAG: adenylyl-sulfate kinase [Dinoroseobacter sp.]|nr:adenylyl-sulfate kinase [Dinoroseobacter sp.]
MVIWMIGMSGSGKTTLGREVVRKWRETATNVVFLDGDEMREIFRSNKGEHAYTIEGRRENADRIVALCELLDRQNINVLCCILSIFDDMRLQNRSRFSEYFEVFMDAPVETLRRRDVKGIYAAFDKGETSNVVGIDIPFGTPTSADMVIDSSGDDPDLVRLANEVLTRAIPR